MRPPKSLQQLFEVRTLEEEQHKAALERALKGLEQIQMSWHVARGRQRQGRALIARSIYGCDMDARLAALVEIETAERDAALFAQRIVAAEQEIVVLRQSYLASRVERRQAETLIRAAEERYATERKRREQRQLDDWFGMRRHTHAPQRDAAGPRRPNADEHEKKSNCDPSAIPEIESGT